MKSVALLALLGALRVRGDAPDYGPNAVCSK